MGRSWIPESDFDAIDCDFIALSYRNESGRIIGYCLGFESCIGPEMNQRIWWLEDIFVEENERGKGIGRKLISKMAKKGFHVSLSLATTPSNNQRRLMSILNNE